MIAFSYRPFLTPLPLWDYWYLLLLPLCIAIAIVYKAIRLDDLRQIPKQAFAITIWIIGGMALGAAGLAVVVQIF